MAWSLAILALAPVADPDGTPPPPRQRHLVIALDVSPSMDIIDAGDAGSETRGERARALLRAALTHVDATVPVSVIAFWNGWKPVAVDVHDREVVANILADLPLQHAFTRGDTDLQQAVIGAADIASAWHPGSAALLIASDGDSSPGNTEPRLPPAYGQVVVIGLGDQLRSSAINGHTSRQEALSLQHLAARLGGRCHDGNVRNLPTGWIDGLLPSAAGAVAPGLAAWALRVLVAAAAIESLLPLALALGGRRRRTAPLLETIHA